MGTQKKPSFFLHKITNMFTRLVAISRRSNLLKNALKINNNKWSYSTITKFNFSIKPQQPKLTWNFANNVIKSYSNSYQIQTSYNYSQINSAHFAADDRAKSQLFLSNFEFDTTWQEIREHVQAYAPVRFVKVLVNDVGKSRGLAIVTLESPDDVDRVIISMNDQPFPGKERPVIVRRNNPKNKPSETGVVVHNVPEGVTWFSLKQHFNEFGTVTWCSIVDNEAYVCFEDDGVIDEVLQNGAEFEGIQLDLSKREPSENENELEEEEF